MLVWNNEAFKNKDKQVRLTENKLFLVEDCEVVDPAGFEPATNRL
tara:strand:+ start:421 stop:555 length:135 start_codon:yes stop_codon:yes gene_type:complete